MPVNLVEPEWCINLNKELVTTDPSGYITISTPFWGVPFALLGPNSKNSYKLPESLSPAILPLTKYFK